MPRPIARIYSLLPLRLRDRVRLIKRPLWNAFSAALERAARGRAYGGPFRGMLLGRTYYPQSLLGTYEREVAPWIERVVAQPFAHVVNVGGGTGYYAVGLALRMPQPRFTVFELTATARDVIAEVARLNGVRSRIDLRGECTPSSLSSAIVAGEPTFVLMDVEGAETELLDPEQVPALRDATILVETHDVIVPGCRETVARRFGRTHTIEEVGTTARTLDDFPRALVPRLRQWFPALALEAVRELRGGPQVFMLLTPRVDPTLRTV